MYNNASEVVREALRFMEMNEQWVAKLKVGHLRQQINEGLTQLDNGQGIQIDSRSVLDAFFEHVKAGA